MCKIVAPNPTPTALLTAPALPSTTTAFPIAPKPPHDRWILDLHHYICIVAMPRPTPTALSASLALPNTIPPPQTTAASISPVADSATGAEG